MKGLEEDEFGRGFYLDGEDLPEQIADPPRADELDAIAWRNIPPETRREWEEKAGDEGLRLALTVDPRPIEWDMYMSRCVVAAEVGIEPYPGG
jgi:sugar/nucleoside kinase (ribokinase family)